MPTLMSAYGATLRSPNCGCFNDESYLKTKYWDAVDRQLLETVGWASIVKSRRANPEMSLVKAAHP